MRRLLVSVAAFAALLLAPCAALGAPVIVTPAPATGLATNVAPIHFEWTDSTIELFFRVLRLDAVTATCPTVPVNATNTSGDLSGLQFTYDEPPPPEGAYCYYVQGEDALLNTSDSGPVRVTYDLTPPVVTAVMQTGGDGCSPAGFMLTGATAAADASEPVTFLADNQPLPPSYSPPGNPYQLVSPNVVAQDAAGNSSALTPFPVPGRVYDPTPPPAPVLEVTTDPSQQKATFNWDPVPDDGAPTQGYHLRTKGPQGTSTQAVPSAPVVRQNLQVDATYEFALSAYDACQRDGAMSVRLVRLNDSTPPSMPIVAGPAFNPASHAITLSWVASDDNIQVDHYAILRNGVPLGATDATVFTDLAVPEHTQLSYVVRAVDTNGNTTDSAPAPYKTPDWTPPTAPVPTLSVRGTTVTLRWPPAADNVGVVGYDVLRDDNQRASMTSAVRTYSDIAVPPGVHTWRVRARDDAQLSATSAPLTTKMAKQVATAKVLSIRLVGGGSGAARYSLKARTRLLVDLRVVGTLAKARLRLYLSSGRGRITVWRGTPGSSAPRLRLGSGLARPGFVTIRLNRTLHAGRIRLVLIPSGRVVVVGEGAHRPSMKTG